ncbi:MAG: SHOCT domain-containing protein [Candidatus Micrarchaeota archaeon]|nr:SHOCT domain-containing protein [Candidatus Micrarchaeota archaeon]
MGFIDWAENAAKETLIFGGLGFFILVFLVCTAIFPNAAGKAVFFILAIICFVYLIYRWNSLRDKAVQIEKARQRGDINKTAYAEESGKVEARKGIDPIKALKMRYVNGEISGTEYERMKKELQD